MKQVWAARWTIIPMAALGLLVGLSAGAGVPVAKQIARQGSVVRLIMSNGRTYCSGVIVGRSIAITAAHCIDENQTTVIVRTQKGDIIITRPVNVDHRMDRAILIGDFSGQIKAKLVTDPAKASPALRSKTRRLVACGYPHGARLYCSEFKPSGKQDFMFKGQGTGIPGMSGGPLLDADTGEVFAVTSQVSEIGEICVAPLFEILALFYEQSSAA